MGTMPSGVKHVTDGLLLVAAVALVADALLGVLTGTLSSVSAGPAAPWWVAGHVLERSRWLVFALLATAVARLVADDGDAAVSRPAAWRAVGVAAIAVPLLWTLALWLVQAVIFTAADRWAIDGEIFRSGDYYRRTFAAYAPWLLGGIAALVAQRHVR